MPNNLANVAIFADQDKKAAQAGSLIVNKFGNIFSNPQEKPKLNADPATAHVSESRCTAWLLSLHFKESKKITKARLGKMTQEMSSLLEQNNITNYKNPICTREYRGKQQHYVEIILKI